MSEQPAGSPPPEDDRRTATDEREERDERDEEQTRYTRGLRVRREVLGDEHVERALGRVTEFDADFQRYITEMAWGDVWARPGLDRRTRSLVTIAILAALGRLGELALHLRATRNTGASPDEIAEVLLHVAVYAGVPAANTAFALAKTELAQQTAPPGSDAATSPGATAAGGDAGDGTDDSTARTGKNTEGQAE